MPGTDDVAPRADCAESARLCAWIDRPRTGGWIAVAEDDTVQDDQAGQASEPWRRRTHADIAGAVDCFAGRLSAAGVRAGDCVSLAIPSGFDAVIALFASWRLGAAINMLPPPVLGGGESYVDHLAALLRATNSRVVVASPDLTGVLAAPADAAGVATVLDVTAARPADAGETAPRPAIAADDCAIIQFTSGSSGTPKGVRISWRNLAANVGFIVESVRWQAGDVTASWLPLYHDMGLVGGLLATLATGGDLLLMRPDQFIRAPYRWVAALAMAQHTVSPSFGLGYAARRVGAEQVEGLDFSSLRSVITGAEPINCEDIAGFTSLLSGGGFDPGSLLPAYGLAEATLMVTISAGWQRPAVLRIDTANTAVGRPVDVLDRAEFTGPPLPGDGWVWGLGRPGPATSVRIVDDAGAELPELVLGEIVVHGPSVAAGYHGGAVPGREADDPSATTLGGGELRTGDAGFVHDGQLYVLGRMGSSLKVRGKAIFMEAMDELIARETGLPKQKLAAVAMQDGSTNPGLVLFAEHAPGEWMDAARTALRADLGPAPRLVIVTGDRGLIRRTSSGKPRRRVLWELFRAGQFDSGAVIHSPDEVEAHARRFADRRPALSRLSDGEIDALLDKALAAVDVAPSASVVLEGSIAEGFGNEGSDVDFLVVSPGDDETPDMPTVLFFDGRRVEVRTRSEGQLNRQLQYAARELGSADGVSVDGAAMAHVNQDLLNRCQRFLRSVVVRQGRPDVEAIRSALPHGEFATMLSAWWHARAVQSLRQAAAMAVLGQHDAQAWARDGLLQSLKCWAAASGETYIESKWTGPQLDRIGDDAVADRYYRIDRALARRESDLSDALGFARELGIDIGSSEGGCEGESLLLCRVPGVTSWPIDGRIHVVRDQDVFVLSDDAAKCWRSVVFGRPLSELAARVGERGCDTVARFVRLGLVGLRWRGGGPLIPAVAMVKPHRPATPPPAATVGVLGIGGGTVEGEITLSPLAAPRFVECASALIWSNVLVENAREDLLGALAQRQWRVADMAADRLVKATVRVVLSTLGCSPLPPDVAPAATLEWLLPDAMADRPAILQHARDAEEVCFSEGDEDARAERLAALDALVAVVRARSDLRFPASFNSREQWRATLDITYDWLRLAAYLDTELPIDEVADLLTSGGAQPHQSTDN